MTFTSHKSSFIPTKFYGMSHSKPENVSAEKEGIEMIFTLEYWNLAQE